MTENIRSITRLITDIYGHDISHFEASFFLKTIKSRFESTNVSSDIQYYEYLSMHPDEAKKLISSLYVSFSEFFRNSLTFAILEHLVLPQLIDWKHKLCQSEIRIWSAGCAAGQESYSIAILLDDLIATSLKPVSYRIFATDISKNELMQGKRGVYNIMAVSNVRLKHLNSYFHSNADTWRVVDRLKDHVDFSVYDMLDDHSISPPGSIFGDFDIIFCSNLLFYYQPDTQKFILNKVYQALGDKGYLVCGETERAIIEKGGLFLEFCRPSAVFKKKGTQGNI